VSARSFGRQKPSIIGLVTDCSDYDCSNPKYYFVDTSEDSQNLKPIYLPIHFEPAKSSEELHLPDIEIVHDGDTEEGSRIVFIPLSDINDGKMGLPPTIFIYDREKKELISASVPQPSTTRITPR